MGKWIDDNKSVYICEDLACFLISHNNLGVKKADEFRKNLSTKNNQSIRIERQIVAVIMKIFAKESMVRQYKIDGLHYDVDLFFIVHK